MQLEYKLKIEQPHNHLAHVTIKARRYANVSSLTFFLPSWSPGSYLMREYARNIRWVKVLDGAGKSLFFNQTHKGQWKIDFDHPEMIPSGDEFTVEYEIYCHELTVRTSHIDDSHAFIHGPSVFMGVIDHQILNPTLEIEFPLHWTKVSTGLKDVSEQREIFKYEAPDYDLLIDTPIEIGCHETDGFMVGGKPHESPFMDRFLSIRTTLNKILKRLLSTSVK